MFLSHAASEIAKCIAAAVLTDGVKAAPVHFARLLDLCPVDFGIKRPY